MISFNTWGFYIFTFIAWVLYWHRPRKVQRKHVLTVINVVFLGLLFYYRKKHLIVFGAFLAFVYGGLKLLERFHRRWVPGIVLVAAAVIFLLFYKYDAVTTLLTSVLPPLSSIRRPAVFLGISFFTFRLISLIVDTADAEEDSAPLDFFHYLNFLTFFPTFIMGPLDRYQRFVDDVENTMTGPKVEFAVFERLIIGCFKKVVLADVLINFSLAAFNDRDILGMSAPQLLASAYVFYLVLYFDFSGYCDIAISVGQLFGVRVPENFNRPYLARNIQDFWQRWHISFMEWLKDYLYFPLLRQLLNLSNKHVLFVNCLSFFMTFLLAGIWHGDGMNFFIYGVLHGSAFMVWLSYKHLLQGRLGKEGMKRYMDNPWVRLGAQVLTFHYFIFSLIFFLNKQDVLLTWLGR